MLFACKSNSTQNLTHIQHDESQVNGPRTLSIRLAGPQLLFDPVDTIDVNVPASQPPVTQAALRLIARPLALTFALASMPRQHFWGWTGSEKDAALGMSL